jgi:ParB/RepB/Spo0J family partition protein
MGLDLPINEIIESRSLIRDIDFLALSELKKSIQRYGILQPIVVFLNENKKYEVICGNHRLRAAKELGLSKVPIVLRQTNPAEARLLSIIENIQRHPMDPIVEGEIYSLSITNSPNDNKMTVNSLAEYLGKSAYYVESRINIYKNLHPKLQKEVGQTLTITNAVALARLPQNKQKQVFKRLKGNFVETQKYGTKGANPGGMVPDIFCTCKECGSRHLRGVSIQDESAARQKAMSPLQES